MRIFLNEPLIALNGGQILHPDGSVATFRTIAIESLTAQRTATDTKETVLEKFRFARALQNEKGEEITLTREHAALINDAVGSVSGYNVQIVGLMDELLTPALRAVNTASAEPISLSKRAASTRTKAAARKIGKKPKAKGKGKKRGRKPKSDSAGVNLIEV